MNNYSPKLKNLFLCNKRRRTFLDMTPRVPTYPDEAIEKIPFAKNENYIDIAAGTGQVFFKLQQKFTGERVATDLSKKQYEVLAQKIDKLNDPNLKHILCDAYDLDKHLNKKYDLITIGQALHWFDIDKLFPYLNEKLLSDDGTIAILSYYALETYLDTEELGVDVNLRNSLSYYENQYYATVEGYFECDRNNLKSGYQQYDFKKYFNTVEVHKFEIETKQSLDSILKYFRTFSAYNTYIEKHPEKEDPVNVYERTILEEYKKLNLKPISPPMLLTNRFFLHILKK
ncbi:hypothetical protein pb186bvf_004986 [Paramecium bursaria]